MMLPIITTTTTTTTTTTNQNDNDNAKVSWKLAITSPHRPIPDWESGDNRRAPRADDG